MIMIYDRFERKCIKSVLKDLKRNGYICFLKIADIQDFILYLTELFNNAKIEMIEEIGDYNFHFEYIKNQTKPFFMSFLYAAYHARKEKITVSDSSGNETTIEASYYPIKKRIRNYTNSHISDCLFVFFDAITGELKKVPSELDTDNITTIEELCKRYENSDTYDFSFIDQHLMINASDIVMRDLVIACVCSNLMENSEVSLESRVKRSKIFIRTMEANIPNFQNTDYFLKMIDDEYEELNSGLKKVKK